jgi:hypothetical protein
VPHAPSFADSLPQSLFVADASLDGSAALAAEAAGAGHAVFSFRSDVARLWMTEIEPRLRAGPITVAGHTSAATLFCLELLAQDYGAEVVRRVPKMRGVSWLIATSPMRRAALAPVTPFAPRS